MLVRRVSTRFTSGLLSPLVLALSVLPAASQLRAQEPADVIQFHGFGSWKFARTNSNQYLGGTRAGDYRTVNFDLNLAAHPMPHLSFLAQVGFDESAEGTATDLAYSFAEWKVSDALRIRGGKIQHPFGIYTEVFDVGTLRPFLTLPQAVYGPSGIVSEAFEGIGLRGRLQAGRGWTLAYDLYGGGISVAEDDRPLEALVNPTGAPDQDAESNRDVLGGRLLVHTPIPGFSVGASAYTGVRDAGGQPIREKIVGGQVDYTSNRLWLRAEAVHNTERGESMHAGYVEAAWFLETRIQLAAQYNRLEVRLPGTDISIAPWLTRHEEGALGVSFWATAELVLKASFHLVDGNRFAFPAAGTAASLLDPALGRHNTRLFQAGMQFSF